MGGGDFNIEDKRTFLRAFKYSKRISIMIITKLHFENLPQTTEEEGGEML